MKGVYPMPENIEEIYEDLKQLDGPVFSVYLNRHPESEGWKIRLKKMQEYVEASEADDEKNFLKFVKRQRKK